MDVTSIRQILFNIESVEQVSLYELDGLLLWPDIRFKVLMDIQSILAGYTPEKKEFSLQAMSKWRRRWRTYSGLLRTAPLALRSSSVGCAILHIMQNDYYRYVDNELYSPNISPLGEAEPDRSLLLDLSPRPPHLSSRGRFPVRNMYWVDFLISKLCKKFMSSYRKKAVNDYSLEVASTIEKQAQITLSSETKGAIRDAVLYPHMYCLAGRIVWQKILQKISPRIINVMCGHYGCSPIIMAARDVGIAVCEKQHGMATIRHVAYNHAPILCTSSLYRKYFPDYFLVYGEYWKKSINIPGTPVVLGNPYYNMKKKNFSSGDSILICLDYDYSLLKDFIIKIANNFPGKAIVRPHPALVEVYKNSDISELKDVELDCSPDIYDVLKKCSVVIAEASTVLFEAASLGLRVFRVKSENVKDLFSDFTFLTVKTPDELFKYLASDETGKAPAGFSQSVFSDDWENNYSKFISNFLLD